MKVEYKYPEKNVATMIIENLPFAEITRVSDDQLLVLTADGEYFDDQKIETELLERYVRDHIDQFPKSELYKDHYVPNTN